MFTVDSCGQILVWEPATVGSCRERYRLVQCCGQAHGGVVQGSRAGLLSRQFVAFGVVGELGLEASQRVLDASGQDPQVGFESGQRRRQRAEVFSLRLAADLLTDPASYASR